MNRLALSIVEWLDPIVDESTTDPTMSALRIEVGDSDNRACITEVIDSIAKTVRQHVNVSAHLLARWLLVNWWRLRWEASRSDNDWHHAHSLAAIGGGFAWPPLVIASDGKFIQVDARREISPDVSAIRYLNSATVDVPALDFEKEVDHFVDEVMAREVAFCGTASELRELQDELREERADRELCRRYRLQAMAGINPGNAAAEWVERMEELGSNVGSEAIKEIAALLPMVNSELGYVEDGLERLRMSPYEVDLSWLEWPASGRTQELPWQTGTRLARQTRQRLGWSSGPVRNEDLEELLGIDVPIPAEDPLTLRGGYRSGRSSRAKIGVRTRIPIEGQRFDLARVIASGLLSAPDDKYLAVSKARTALQKSTRAFAQELLCPWEDLDEFTEEHGFEDDDIEEAAAYFQVSECVVRYALFNNGKVNESILPVLPPIT